MMTKSNSSVQHFQHVLSTVCKCDVILRNGNKQFIGLYYDSEKVDAPSILCKEAGNLSYCLYKYLETTGVVIVDNGILTQEIFDNVIEGHLLPSEYFDSVAVIYSNLEKFKDKKNGESFQARLNKDVVSQINTLEKRICKRALNRFRKKNIKYKNMDYSLVESFLDEGISVLPDYKRISFEKFYNETYQTVEYYLGTELRKYSIEFCFFIFVSKLDGFIYICAPGWFESLKIEEAERALELIRELSKATCNELLKYTEKYCKEFEINVRLYEIARNTMKIMLELNYKQNGIEYGFSSDTRVFQIFLRKKAEKKTMFSIVITYKEFMRSPKLFKDFLKEPHKKEKWNFWCSERKFNQKYFDKKFQPIS